MFYSTESTIAQNLCAGYSAVWRGTRGVDMRFTMKLLPLLFLTAGAGASQSAPPRKDIPTIAKAANGAIVSIIMSDKNGQPIAQGSGFLISKDGRIVTNYHVIRSGTSAIVKLPDGAFFPVDGVLVADPEQDLAIIKAHGENFHTVELGDSNRVQVGDEVVAIGNPLSMESTVSDGIVSAIRAIDQEGGKFLQITAPISPGSSGGPLFNMEGQVVGITTMYLKGGENLNFAIPINALSHLLHSYESLRHTHPGYPVGAFPNLPPEEATTDDKNPGGGETAPPSVGTSPARTFYKQFYDAGRIDGIVPTSVCFYDDPKYSENFFTFQEIVYNPAYAKAFKTHLEVLQKTQKETVNGVTHFYTDAAQAASDAQALQTMRSIESSEPEVQLLSDDDLTGFGILYGQDTEGYLRGGGRVLLLTFYIKGIESNSSADYRWTGPGTGNSWFIDVRPPDSSIKTSKEFLRIDSTTRRFQLSNIIYFNNGSKDLEEGSSGVCEKVPPHPPVNP